MQGRTLPVWSEDKKGESERETYGKTGESSVRAPKGGTGMLLNSITLQLGSGAENYWIVLEQELFSLLTSPMPMW